MYLHLFLEKKMHICTAAASKKLNIYIEDCFLDMPANKSLGLVKSFGLSVLSCSFNLLWQTGAWLVVWKPWGDLAESDNTSHLDKNSTRIYDTGSTKPSAYNVTWMKHTMKKKYGRIDKEINMQFSEYLWGSREDFAAPGGPPGAAKQSEGPDWAHSPTQGLMQQHLTLQRPAGTGTVKNVIKRQSQSHNWTFKMYFIDKSTVFAKRPCFVCVYEIKKVFVVC